MKELSILTLTSILLASNAFAENFYIAGELGIAKPNIKFSDDDFSFEADKGSAQGRFVLGIMINNQMRTEVDFYSTAIGKTNLPNKIMQKIYEDDGKTFAKEIMNKAFNFGLGMSIFYDRPVTRQFTLFVGPRIGYSSYKISAGVNVFELDRKNQIDSNEAVDVKITFENQGLDLGLAFGADYKFNKNLKLGSIFKFDKLLNTKGSTNIDAEKNLMTL